MSKLVFGATEVPGLVFSFILAPPFAIISMVALRDLFRQVTTTFAAAPRRKLAIMALVAVALWLLTALVVMPILANPLVTGHATATLLGVAVLWTPGVVAYAWATCPGADHAERPIERSRTDLLIDKHFGLSGQYFELKVQGLQLLSVILQSYSKLPLLGAFVSVR